MNADQVREMLRAECEKAGGIRSWSRLHGVSAAYVSRVLLREKDVSAAITKPLNLVRVVAFEIDRKHDAR